ncbi:MAG: hypothetical protein EXS03_08635 [Phycisphaerales bacterium]|nr:hypothetical protein [Phycisphaerales bacterium]
MLGLARTIAVVLVAFWLPLCCCQVMALAAPETGCCGGKISTSVPHDAVTDSRCCVDETASDESPSDNRTCCVGCCLDKGPPPSPISLDGFFILAQLHYSVAPAPMLFDPSILHPDEIRGRWDSAPGEQDPAPPPSAHTRCSQLSLWLI